jgi:glyoxylase-like metal-dependent hydrolase (beta-lactamase superfamily II)
MREIADGLFALEMQIEGYPAYAIGIHLMGDVLVDAGIHPFAEQILGELEGYDVGAHALTHAHMDHVGASHAVCEALSLPLYAPAAEADNVESGDFYSLVPDLPQNRQDIDVMVGGPHPVSRRLSEGDEVGGFVVIDSPGHSPGHISYWRESDRVLIAGDAMRNWDMVTQEVALQQPLDIHTVDPPRNRASIRKLAALDPLIVCFGHGPALTEPDLLHAFVERLSDEVRV